MKAKNYLQIISSVVLVVLFVLVVEQSKAQDNLPKHTVAKNSSLAPKKGRRIEIHVENPDLSKQECILLINAYRGQGAPDGQVSVRKPSSQMGGSLEPWCLENFDGKGIIFQDFFF